MLKQFIYETIVYEIENDYVSERKKNNLVTLVYLWSLLGTDSQYNRNIFNTATFVILSL